MTTTESASSPAVVVRGLSKGFRVPHHRVQTLKERALHPFRRTRFDRLEAFRDLSFEVAQGEFFGIVGRNGSGKSTLLKCMAGIYGIDAGEAYVDGRMSTFIELGVGFNPDLVAHENVVLNGVMLGLSPAEARRRTESIVAFADLQEFTELKLKNYSSGMMVRLAFSVMIHVDADVLLIDEVLAVGDAAFQQKCYDEFHRIRDEGRTVLLVTHDMSAVVRFCDRAMLLEKGEMKLVGDPEEVTREYLRVNFAVAEDDGDDAPDDVPRRAVDARRHGDGRASIEETWWEDEQGVRTMMLANREPCTFAMRVRFNDDVEDPQFGFLMQNGIGQNCFQATTAIVEEDTGNYAEGEEAVVRIRFDNVFSPERYLITPRVARRGAGGAVLDEREHFGTIVVTGLNLNASIVDVPFTAEVHRGAEAPPAAREVPSA